MKSVKSLLLGKVILIIIRQYMRKNMMSTHCSAQYARKSFYLQHIKKGSTSSQANPISRSNRRRDIVIDEVDEEFDRSDLSMAFTQFDNKISYSLKL